MALSDGGIRKLKVEKRTFLSDGNGLYLEVTPTGIKRWWYRYMVSGKNRKIAIGYYPEVTLMDARTQAITMRAEQKNAEVAIDPLEERGKERLAKIAQAEEEARQAEMLRQQQEAEMAKINARLTFQQLYDRWFKAVISKHKDQGEEMERLFTKDVLPFIGSMYAEDVTRQNISTLLLNIVERDAKVIAGRTLSSIRQCYGYGIGIGLLEHDPTSHLKKAAFAGKSVIRERVLSEEELVHLLTVALPASSLSPKGKAAVKILLATAARIGELLKAKYEHIDLTRKQWFIPKENAKNGKEHLIHLSDYAVRAFQELFIYVEHDTWLFPDRTKTTHVSVKTLTKQIGDRQTDSPLQNRASDTTSLRLSGGKWTPHDLRRTAATLMGSLKVQPHVIEKCLNHMEENRMVRTYQHAALFEEREEAFKKLGVKIEALAKFCDVEK